METVWNKYLEFECHVGDLTSMLKVENRRIEKLLNTNNEEDNSKEKEKRQESALLIDRYRFLDLFPCTKEELRSIGYKDISSHQTSELTSSYNPREVHSKNKDDEIDLYVKPDMSQMIPFKPRRIPAPGSHPVSGGEFPI